MTVRVKYIPGAFKKIRHAFAGHVADIATSAVSPLPDGYEVVIQNDPSTQRPRAYIVARSKAAQRDDAENSTMLKTISSLRGR